MFLTFLRKLGEVIELQYSYLISVYSRRYFLIVFETLINVRFYERESAKRRAKGLGSKTHTTLTGRRTLNGPKRNP